MTHEEAVRKTRGPSLPPNLAPCAGPETGLHHGFKGLQIAASALTAEALALATPASTHSRSTEAHNQDKVSMGTIAARRTRDCLTLAIDVAAMHLLALCQAADLRAQPLPDPLCGVHRLIRQHSAPVTHDRPLHDDIATIAGLIRRHSLEDLR
nr:aromatic amino acid lyase [Actinomadura rifamycini]